MNKKEIEKLISDICELISIYTAGTYTGGVEGARESAEEIVQYLKDENIIK